MGLSRHDRGGVWGQRSRVRDIVPQGSPVQEIREIWSLVHTVQVGASFADWRGQVHCSWRPIASPWNSNCSKIDGILRRTLCDFGCLCQPGTARDKKTSWQRHLSDGPPNPNDASVCQLPPQPSICPDPGQAGLDAETAKAATRPHGLGAARWARISEPPSSSIASPTNGLCCVELLNHQTLLLLHSR